MGRLSSCGLLLLAIWQAFDAGALSAQAIVVSADSIASARALSTANNTVDRLIQGVEVPDGRVALAALRRIRPETSALIHSNVTEIYLITQGSGTLITGGTLSETTPNDLARVWAGPGLSGVHAGGETRRVAVGDVIIVPAGTAHRFQELSDVIEYLVFRFEAVN